MHSVETAHQLQILSAHPGLGKTTLLKTVLARLHDRVDSAFIVHIGAAADLLGFIIRALGLNDPDPALTARRQMLNRHFSSRSQANRRFLLIIDEAQGLDQSAFGELASMLASGPESLQIILSGQTQLAAVLNNTGARALRDQVTASHHLFPLQMEETSNYVRHRLHVAGYTGPDLFTRDALELVARESSGIPRNINSICFNALLYGANIRSARIDCDVITHILPNCAFRALCLIDKPEAAASTIAGALRDWLRDHGGVWSGTTWELHQQLRSAKPSECEHLAISSHVELAETIATSSISLRGAGVEAEFRSVGRPRHLILRLVENSLRH